jgi:hypothetical protein
MITGRIEDTAATSLHHLSPSADPSSGTPSTLSSSLHPQESVLAGGGSSLAMAPSSAKRLSGGSAVLGLARPCRLWYRVWSLS